MMQNSDTRNGPSTEIADDWEEAARSVRLIRRGRRRSDEPFVNLTSMVDVLSVLLFFLLTIYSGGGYFTILPAGLELPTSNVTTPLKRNIEVAVLKDRILVDREPVADDPAAFLATEELLLPALAANLSSRKPAEGEATETPRVTIEADRSTPFRLLKKVMYTVDQAGFHRQSLAVRQVAG